jgi:plasmid maintenance system antidote protein VapI
VVDSISLALHLLPPTKHQVNPGEFLRSEIAEPCHLVQDVNVMQQLGVVDPLDYA